MSDVAASFELIAEIDAAKFLGKEIQSLRNERSQGKGPRYVRLGRTIYYPRGGLQEYINANTVTPTYAPTLITGRKRAPRPQAQGAQPAQFVRKNEAA